MEATWPQIIDIAVKVLGVLGGVVSFVITIVVLVLRKSFVSQKELDDHKEEQSAQVKDLHDRLNRGENRFTRLEDRLQQIPNKDDIHNLSREITKVYGKVETAGAGINGLKGQLDGLTETVKLLVGNELGKTK